MSKKEWKYHPAECNFCGSSSQIFTYHDLPEGWGYDTDEMRCPTCGAKGQWVVYDEADSYADWIECGHGISVDKDCSKCDLGILQS